MPDGVVTVGTQVNVGTLKAGMAEAEAAVKAATQNMADAQAQFGKAAEAGSSQAAAALKVYQTELQAAQSALAGLTGAEEKETAVLRSNVSARMAASAELRVLEGNFMGSTRAAGAFLSTLPGIGAAMQLAFPVFGVVALVEILLRGVEALAKWQQGLGQLADTEKAVHDQLIKNAEDELRHSTILVKANYDLAIAKAGTPIEKDQIRVQMESALVALGEKRLTQLEAAKKQLEDYAAQQKAIASAWSQETVNLAGGGMSGMSGAGTIGTAFMAKRAQGQADSINAPGPHGEKSPIAQNQSLIEEADAAVKESTADQLNAQTTLSKGYEKQADAAKKAFGEMVEMQVRSDQMALESGRKVTEELTRSWTQAQEADEKAAKNQEEQHEAATRKFVEEEKEKAAAAREALEAQSRGASESYRGTEQTTQSQVQSGTMTPQQRITILQQAAAQEYAAKQAANLKMQQLDAGNVTKYQADLDQQAQLTQAYYQKQQELAQQSTTLMMQPYKTFTTQVSDQFTQLTDTWLQGTQRMSVAFTRFGDQIAMDLINSLLKMGEKWVTNEALMTAQHLLGITQRQTADAASAAATQAQTSATNTATALSNAAVAATGAAASVAAIPLVGPALAPAAAATTLADMSGFIAMASFDQGTSYIPRDGIAMLHRGEAVLPPPQTEAMMNAMNGGRGRSSGGDNHFHYSPNISAIDGPSVAGALQQHGQSFMREQNRQLRLMNKIQ